jgi:hypothetical protein
MLSNQQYLFHFIPCYNTLNDSTRCFVMDKKELCQYQASNSKFSDNTKKRISRTKAVYQIQSTFNESTQPSKRRVNIWIIKEVAKLLPLSQLHTIFTFFFSFSLHPLKNSFRNPEIPSENHFLSFYPQRHLKGFFLLL